MSPTPQKSETFSWGKVGKFSYEKHEFSMKIVHNLSPFFAIVNCRGVNCRPPHQTLDDGLGCVVNNNISFFNVF